MELDRIHKVNTREKESEREREREREPNTCNRGSECLEMEMEMNREVVNTAE